MNSSLKQKKQIEEDKQKLIEHIEAKLQELRNQRKRLQNGNLDSVPEQKNEQKSSMQSLKKTQNKNVITQRKISNTDYMYQKLHQNEVKQNLKNLQQLYNKKKQLQAIGVIPNSIDQVDKLYSDPKNKKKIAQYDPQAKQKKDLILKQQMERIEFLLKKKRVTKKQISEMKEHHYSNLMKDKIQKLQRYEELLIYNSKGLKLSLIEKQELIDIVFDTLKDFDEKIKKQTVKDFLLANQKFSSVFYITQEQIFNDLEVFQSQTDGKLTRNQFYQFIKSIEISNPALNPSMKRRNYQQKSGKDNINTKPNIEQSRVSKLSVQNQKIEDERKKKMEMLSYLKKIFQYFDQKKQGLIQRERFLIALRKCLLMDTKKQSFLKKQDLQQFTDYLQKIRQNKNKKSYYMKLQSKFLGWSQINQFYNNFIKNKTANGLDQNDNFSQKDTELQSKQPQEQLDDFEQEKKQEQDIGLVENIRQGNLQQYFEEYGWRRNQENEPTEKPFVSQLSGFDEYYKNLRQKHGNQIEWNNNFRDKLSLANNQEFKSDFHKLESYIKNFQNPHDN